MRILGLVCGSWCFVFIGVSRFWVFFRQGDSGDDVVDDDRHHKSLEFYAVCLQCYAVVCNFNTCFHITFYSFVQCYVP